MIKSIGGGLLSSHVPLALLCATLVCAGTVRAEADYEYARALLDREDPSFQTVDLVKHLIAQLEANPRTLSEAKLIHAALDRHEARKASVGMRATLLAEAEKLYGEILAGPNTFAHYSIAQRDAGTLDFDAAKALKKSALEEPANAAQYSRDAGALFAKLVQKYKTDAEKAYPAFEKAVQEIDNWTAKNDPDSEGKPIPAALVAAANKAFEAWIDPDQRYVAMLLEQLDCIPETDGARKAFAAEVAKICEVRTGNEKLSRQETAVAWYEMMEGKSYALLLNATEAENHWTEAWRAPTLQKLITRERIRLGMKLKKYADVVKQVEELDLAQMLADDAGKEILETYTHALTLVPDVTADDYQRAIRALQALIDHESPNGIATPWSNQFSVAMADVVTSARSKLMLPSLRATEWFSTATGYTLRADAEHLRYTELNATDRAHARPQFEKAVSEYENAAECFRRAISAAHAATPAVRLSIEPKAWLASSAVVTCAPRNLPKRSSRTARSSRSTRQRIAHGCPTRQNPKHVRSTRGK